MPASKTKLFSFGRAGVNTQREFEQAYLYLQQQVDALKARLDALASDSSGDNSEALALLRADIDGLARQLSALRLSQMSFPDGEFGVVQTPNGVRYVPLLITKPT